MTTTYTYTFTTEAPIPREAMAVMHTTFDRAVRDATDSYPLLASMIREGNGDDTVDPEPAETPLRLVDPAELILAARAVELLLNEHLMLSGSDLVTIAAAFAHDAISADNAHRSTEPF